MLYLISVLFLATFLVDYCIVFYKVTIPFSIFLLEFQVIPTFFLEFYFIYLSTFIVLFYFFLFGFILSLPSSGTENFLPRFPFLFLEVFSFKGDYSYSVVILSLCFSSASASFDRRRQPGPM